MNFVFKWMESPVGPLKLVGNATGLAAILWKSDSLSRVRLGPQAADDRNGVLTAAERQLAE